MEKPKPKQDVAIKKVIPDMRVIIFVASKDSKLDFENFGTIYPHVAQDEYFLSVSPRYDFNEVLNYIQSYNG